MLYCLFFGIGQFFLARSKPRLTEHLHMSDSSSILFQPNHFVDQTFESSPLVVRLTLFLVLRTLSFDPKEWTALFQYL